MNPEQVTRPEFLFLSVFEKTLFYLLVFAALGYAAWQILARVRVWMQGKPITWAGPHREGFWRFVPTADSLKYYGEQLATYVLAQRKVRSSRPKSGAPMHLLIFFGFLTLFIGTTLLAINTYSPLKFHYGAYYVIYEQTLDWMGLAFVVGVAWALVRRYMLSKTDIGRAALKSAEENPRRRPQTTEISDYLALVLLLLVGVTGYLLEAARIAANPQVFDSYSSPVGYSMANLMGAISPTSYHLVWWFHMLWVLVFFAVFPQMRLRHIAMAIASTAGAPRRAMGSLVAISIEEVEQTGLIGVSEAKDYSRWHLMSLDACMECGRCTEVCPAWNMGKPLNPKQVVQDIRGAMESGQKVAEAVSEEALWACTTCNACQEACPVLIRHVDLIVDARRNLVAEGQLAGSAAVMLRQTGSSGHAWGAPSSSREDWMKDAKIPLAREGGEFEYLFWVGCAGATDPGAIRTTKSVARLLEKAGVSYACLGKEETCTGDAARRVGDEFLYQEKAAQNIATFDKYKVKKIVTPCPHCFNTLKNEYSELGGNFEVVHHSQLLSDLIADGRLQSATPEDGSVAIHDPCYLARVNNESDAPRSLLGEKTFMNDEIIPRASVKRLREPEQFGRKTLCCGAGGGRMWMDDSPDVRPANRRAEQLLATGASTIGVGCPFCRIMLEPAITQLSGDKVKLMDFAELVDLANRES